MRLLPIAVVVLLGMTGCSDADDGRAPDPTGRETPSSPDDGSTTTSPPDEEPTTPVTVGRFDLPEGPVPADLAALEAEIDAALDDADVADIGPGIGAGEGLMYVSLRLGREHIADALVARYGDKLRVDVGGMPWPLDAADELFTPCEPLPAADAPAGITAKVRPDDTEVEFADAPRGTLVVSNDTDAEVLVGWGGGGVDGYLVRPGTDEPVARFIGARTMELRTTPVPPGGESEPIDLLVGAVSCTPETGTAVQPGRYELVAIVSISGSLESGEYWTLRSERTEIVVSAP